MGTSSTPSTTVLESCTTGSRLPRLEILAPGPGYDPLRATYSIWIETWLNQLGFDAEANPTDFNALVAAVDPDANNEVDFDMFILGWSLGNPAFPDYHKAFFYGANDSLLNGGSNRGGYNSEEFNALSDQFDQAAESEEEAYDLMWQMEEVLFDGEALHLALRHRNPRVLPPGERGLSIY